MIEVSVTQRIKELAEHFGGVKKFSSRAGLVASSLRSAIHRNGEVKSDALEKIISNIPEVNPYWLLLGEGEMFIDGVAVNPFADPPDEETERLTERLIDLLEKRVHVLERELKNNDPDKARELGIE